MAPAAAAAAALPSLLDHHHHHHQSSSSSSQRVCVMDASGSLGSSLVHRLLHRGYSVHAAFHTQAAMHSFQTAYGGGADGSSDLKLFHSDPLDYHSIMDALKGCSGLFYSFEPPSDQPIYDEFMADMEVRAAHNVLEACAQTHTMDKVVFTSSATAVIWRDRNDSGAATLSQSDVDERNWSNVNFCKKFKLWHGLSKTLAERTAWALAMDREVNMVSINGGLLLSPDLTITSPYLKGAAEMYEDGVFVTVDLRFLVDSHICVFEDVSAYGRYLCFNHVIDCNEEAVKLAQMLLPAASANECSSNDREEESKQVQHQRISNKKLNKLMVDFELNQVPS